MTHMKVSHTLLLALVLLASAAVAVPPFSPLGLHGGLLGPGLGGVFGHLGGIQPGQSYSCGGSYASCNQEHGELTMKYASEPTVLAGVTRTLNKKTGQIEGMLAVIEDNNRANQAGQHGHRGHGPGGLGGLGAFGGGLGGHGGGLGGYGGGLGGYGGGYASYGGGLGGYGGGLGGYGGGLGGYGGGLGGYGGGVGGYGGVAGHGPFSHGLAGALGAFGAYGQQQAPRLDLTLEVQIRDLPHPVDVLVVFTEAVDQDVCTVESLGHVLTGPDTGVPHGQFGYGASLLTPHTGGYGGQGGQNLERDFGVIAQLTVQGGSNVFKVTGLGQFTSFKDLAGRSMSMCEEVVMGIHGKPVCTGNKFEVLFCAKLGYAVEAPSLLPPAPEGDGYH